MSDCGCLKHYLGTKFEYNQEDGIMMLSQESIINIGIDKFEMSDCNTARTPMEKGLQLPIAREDECNQSYRKLLGSLMYIMLSVRPDICYLVGCMGRFQQNPGEAHWKSLKRVLRYLKGTKKTKLVYRKN